MTAASPSYPHGQDQDAMRVVVAAIVAQHASIDERESALRMREQAAAEQERQLAERLASKQRQLESLHEQLADGREKLRQDRVKHGAMLEEAAKIHTEAVSERDRLRRLQSKFTRRWKRHWAAERESCQQKQAEVAAKAAELLQELAAAEQLRTQLEAASKQLKSEQSSWRLEVDRKEQELAQLRDSIDEKQRALADSELRFRDEKARLEHECESLRAEARGLEKRISSARRVMIAHELNLPRTPAPSIEGIPESPPPLPLPQAIEAALFEREEYHRRCQAALRKQAATLADQRCHLAEMCERLAQAEADWQAKQIEAVAEMERLTIDLQQREVALADKVRNVDAEGMRCRQERDQLGRWRKELERAAADLALRQSSQRGEWDRLRAEIAQRERFAERREHAMNLLLERWRKRRQAEADRLREFAKAAIEARGHFVKGREEWHNRAESLREAQQALAEQSLALEEARQEFLAETDRPKAAARRLERHRRRWARRNAAAKRELTSLRDSVAADDAELCRIYDELQTEQSALVAKQQELAQQLTELENERRKAGEITRQFETARAAWLEQRRAYELQLTDLWAEIDRLRSQGDILQRSAA